MRRGLLLLLVVALVALPLALAFQDLSRVILTEVMRTAWMVRQQLESLPQSTLWGLLLVVVLAAAAGSLFGWSQAGPGAGAGSSTAPGQVRELSRWIRNANLGRYFEWTLNRYITNLAWEVLAYRERTLPRKLKQRFRAGEIELPPAIVEYVESSGLLRPPAQHSLWNLLRRRPRRRTTRDLARPQLEEVVRFLEEQLEVTHDPGSH